jgi:hypothetical protein
VDISLVDSPCAQLGCGLLLYYLRVVAPAIAPAAALSDSSWFGLEEIFLPHFLILSRGGVGRGW